MTTVFITVDTECREERWQGGRLLPAAGYDLRVWGRFANQGRELGIGLIMDELQACDLAATFFVDPFGGEHFGLEELARICGEIRRRGHDVQLHAHPRQRHPDWITAGRRVVSDEMADYPVEAQTRLLEQGKGWLVGCGVPAPEIVAFRAGSYAANNDTWEAMRRTGLRIGSSYNACYLSRTCRIAWPRVEVEAFEAKGGVLELPITSFLERDGTFRHLQITAISLEEITGLLLQAHGMGIREVTIVTHSFEFCHIDSVSRRRGRPNRVNLSRLRGLCRFLERHRDRFPVQTVRWLAGHPPAARPGDRGKVLRGRPGLRYKRLLEQAYKRLESRLPL